VPEERVYIVPKKDFESFSKLVTLWEVMIRGMTIYLRALDL